MSVNEYGICVDCGRANLMITIGIHIHDIHEMVPGVYQGKRNEGKPQKKSRK